MVTKYHFLITFCTKEHFLKVLSFTADEYIVETQRQFTKVPSIVGALLAILLLLILVCLAIWYYKFGGKKFGIPNNLKRKISIGNQNSETSGSNPRSFENPYFNQEVTMSNLQVKASLI